MKETIIAYAIWWLRSMANVRKANKLSFICIMLILAFASDSTLAQISQPLGPRNKSESWIQHEINTVRYEVALEWLMGNETGSNSKRVLFVYLEPRYFNRDNVLLVFGNISSKIPQPTILNVTLLTNRNVLKERVQNYSGWIMSNETPFTRVTAESDTCCPMSFSGAQFDRYPDEGNFVICTDGKPSQISVDYKIK